MAVVVGLNKGKTQIIFYYGGKPIDGPAVNAEMTAPQIAAAISGAARAIENESLTAAKLNPARAREFAVLRSNPVTAARRIHAQLQAAKAHAAGTVAAPAPKAEAPQKPRGPKLREVPRVVKPPKITVTPEQAEKAKKVVEEGIGAKLPEPKRKVMKAAEAGKLMARAMPAPGSKKAPDQAAIERLAKNRDALEAYLATGDNRERMAALLFRNISAVLEKKDIDFEFTIRPLRSGFYGTATELSALDDSQKLGFVRSFLYDYIAKGNDRFKSETRHLRTEYQGKELGRPLDTDTLIAASAYLWRLAKNNPEKELDLKPPAKIEAPATAPVPRIPASRVPIVAAIGDSITAGGMYAKALEQILRKQVPGARVSAFGVVGEETGAIRARFAKDVLSRKPPFNTVIIQGGGNDVYDRGYDAEKTKRNISDMMSLARKNGMEIVVVTLVPQRGYRRWTEDIQKRIDELNNWMLKLKDLGVRVVDLSELGDSEKRLKKEFDAGGGLHPNRAGAAMIGRLLAAQAFADMISKGVPTVKAPEGKAAEGVLKAAESLATLSEGAKPDELLKLHRTMESVRESARSDEARKLAVQRVFNDLKSGDALFRSFMAIFEKYSSIRAEGDSLRTDKADARVGLATESMLEFLNWRANVGVWKSGMDNFNWDLRALNLELGRKLKPGEDTKLPQRRDAYADALLGVSVYRWRLANPEKDGGAWAKKEAPKKEEKAGEWIIR